MAGSWPHEPVLVDEALATWVTDPRGRYLDGTVGLGGHAEALLERFPDATVVGLDRDAAALELASRRLTRFAGRVRLQQADFADMASVLERIGGERVIGVLLDLGVSSLQLDDPGRGFSHAGDGPLRMTLDPASPEGAEEFLSTVEEGTLKRILKDLGELPFAGRAARAILEARDRGALDTTGQLAEALRRAGAASPRRLSQAFQAIRIAVNRELDSLAAGLEAAARLLPPGGTLTVISFESLMDRMVKHAIRPPRSRRPLPGEPDPRPRWTPITRRVVRPSREEAARNPRARSARLRAAARTTHA